MPSDLPMRIFQQCTARKEKFSRLIDGTAIQAYTRSPFGYWCSLFAPQEKRDQPTEFMELLFSKGKEHEKKTVAEKYPGLVEIKYKDKMEGFMLLLRQMALKANAFHGMPLYYMPEGLLGIPDITELSKEKGKSIFGNYYYIVKDVKLARNIRDHHIMQVAFYNYVLGKVQGFTPEQFFVIDGNMTEHPFGYREYEHRLMQALHAAREIAEEKKHVEPVFGKAAWPWQSYNDELAIKKRDVSLVTGVKETMKAKLATMGIGTVEDLARADPQRLTKLERVGEASAKAMVLSAEALSENKVITLHKPQIPQAKLEFFMDFEGTGMTDDEEFKDIDYLIGLIVRKGGSLEKGKYVHFFAPRPDQEKQMLYAFLEYVGKHPDYWIYHWHHYERTHMQRLLEKYRVRKAVADLILTRMVDLYKIITKSFVFPTYGRSIKDIAKFVGFKWRQEKVDAMESIALYLKYTRDPMKNRPALKKILRYNEDDCAAMVAVMDWAKRA